MNDCKELARLHILELHERVNELENIVKDLLGWMQFVEGQNGAWKTSTVRAREVLGRKQFSHGVNT